MEHTDALPTRMSRAVRGGLFSWLIVLSAAASGGPASGAGKPPEFPSSPPWAGRSVLVQPDGTWENIRTAPLPDGNGRKLVVCTSSDNGAKWSAPKDLGASLPEGEWRGITALQTPGRELQVFLPRTRLEGDGKGPGIGLFIDVWHLRSYDDRTRWSTVKPIFEGYVGALSSGITMDSGRILLPFGMLISKRPPKPPNGRHETTVLYSDDGGETFTMSPARLTSPVPENYNGSGEGACEPAIVQLKDGRVLMLMRTQAGTLYESISKDGINWPTARPSRFHSSTGPPSLVRLKDDRIALFWNCAEMPPRVGRDGVYGGRDALHAVISDPTLTSWHGWREIYRDPTRNDSPPKDGDRGTAYPHSVPMSDGRIAVCSGQGDGRRKLMWVDPAWLEEGRAESSFTDGVESWTVFKSFGPASGFWRDRVQGAGLVEHPEKPGEKVLNVRRPDEKDPDGATWNFPMARSGKLTLRVMPKAGFAGATIALADRFFDPSDVNGDEKALFLMKMDKLTPDAWHEVVMDWDIAARRCRVTIDGKDGPVLELANPTPSGVSYLRLRSTAANPDPVGFVVESVGVEVTPGFQSPP